MERAFLDAGLATDALLVILNNQAGLFVFRVSANRAIRHACRLVAMVAAHRNVRHACCGIDDAYATQVHSSGKHFFVCASDLARFAAVAIAAIYGKSSHGLCPLLDVDHRGITAMHTAERGIGVIGQVR